ncbi:MAG: YHS domain-containing protein [Burkholderiales bacterium]|jgi:YHS domain-containing protein|nr:YHS domain-containing protein [Burkholderiales bacterium]
MSFSPLRSLRRLFLATFCMAVVATGSAHAAPPINTLKDSLFGGHQEFAILGYDTVAYFTDGKAVKGNPAYATEWMGAKWLFASQAHLDAFRAAPEKYAPQYGGYCAYGVSQDHLVKIQPDQFRILDGKLYLNYDADVQKKWLVDPVGFIRLADAKFKPLLAK